MPEVLLFNPRSAEHSWRIPNSILQIAASIEGLCDYALIDGNRERDPWSTLEKYLRKGDVRIFGCSVMPGPQLRQAIPFTKKILQQWPEVRTVWGGYFPSNHAASCLRSGIHFVIDGPGDSAFPMLLQRLRDGGSFADIPNLLYQENGKTVRTPKAPLPDMDQLPRLPYEQLDKFYPLRGYLGKSYLGTRTAAYHSSFGCPFTCSFCAVVPIYNARWKGRSAQLIFDDIMRLKTDYGADAVEFHDNNFFVSEKRVVEFSKLMLGKQVTWWGEGRIDTVDKYSDASLKLMHDAGCKMIFFGAESSSDELLKKMDKGGTQSSAQLKKFAGRMKRAGIIPEYSFVLGFPAETPEKVMAQIDADMEFIREIKSINPDTEIIIYVYSPVPTEGSDMFEKAKAAGFRFPESLDDWLMPQWQGFDLRKNPLTPWLTPAMIRKIRNFETVLNARYPTITDFKLNLAQRKIIRALSWPRYASGFFRFPYELKALQKFWLRYRQPEIEGFYTEQ